MSRRERGEVAGEEGGGRGRGEAEKWEVGVGSAGAAAERGTMGSVARRDRPRRGPRWGPEQEGAQGYVAHSWVDFNTPPLERWARRA